MLVERFVDGADRVPGRRGGQFTVDQKHRGVVLQCLEGPDHLAELLTGTQMRGDHFDAPLRHTRCRTGDESHGDTCCTIEVDPSEHAGLARVILGQSQNPYIGNEVGAVYRFDCRRGLSGVYQHPDDVAVLAAGADQHNPRRTCAHCHARRPADHPSRAVGACEKVTIVRKDDCRGYT